MHNDLELQAAYQKSNRERRIFESKIGSVIGIVLIPAGSVLDYFVYPELFPEFLMIRLGATAVLALWFLLHMTEGGKRYIEVVTFGWLITAQLAICEMIFRADGYASTYYAGLNLAIFGLGILLPTSVAETAAFCITTIIAYLAACFLSGEPIDHPSILVNNLFFLVLTSIIATTAVFFKVRRRFVEFSLSYELDRKNQQLAQLDRQKTEFFANISHELRTPLTLILAPVQEILERGSRSPDALASRLGVVRDNAFRLLKLVNDLLDVLRMEEGKDELEVMPIDLNSMVQAMADGMIHLAESKGIALEKELGCEQIVVDGDRRALEKIIVNLANNAIKFTERGGKVRLACMKESDRAVLSVTDSGIGIAYEEQTHIFDRFHQVDASSTRRHRGTGLGLALVKEMTERMAGQVEVESRLGEGTTMRVVLPLSAHEEGFRDRGACSDEDSLERLHRLAEYRGGLTLEEDSEGPEITGTDDSDSRPTVLVVEDEPDMRRYLVDILREEYRVMEAKTGRAGLKLACDFRPNLLLLDLMLPEIDGLEVCKRIRQDEACRGIKIMLLTARIDEQSKLTALEHGANDFLTKPFSTVEVKTRLRNLLATATLERDLRVQNEDLQQALQNLERTQAQLIQSEKLNALGSLAAGLLHEINNPLNYSLTALQLIRGDAAIKGNELVQEVIGDIDEGMQRVRVIVSDLRAFAYPSEAEKSSPFDVRGALESAERFTAHELSGISVESDFPADTFVMGSKTHITQVLVNLLANSAKAIKQSEGGSGGEIRVTGMARDGRLIVTVADNGAGMDEKTVERIFDPFFTTRDVGEGTGLGLSICHTIVANHGGHLVARSQPGEGAELAFDLPIEGEEHIDAP